MKRILILAALLLISCSREVAYEPEAIDPMPTEPDETVTEIPEVTDLPTETPDAPGAPDQVAAAEPMPDKVFIEGVPFTSQAPTGNWDDERYQDGCEEASILMAMRWVNRDNSLTADEALKEIAAMAAFEVEQKGYHNDTNAADTAQLIRDFYKYENVEARSNITAEDIQTELAKGNVVLVPLDGQKLNNPYFTQPGPERHKLIIFGYDKKKDVFITHDPGTRRGKNYEYPTAVLMNAILDYPSGKDVPLTDYKTAMIIVRRAS